MLCQGLRDKEIAAELGLAEPTVRTYVSRVLVKTGAMNRTQLGLMAQDEPASNHHDEDGQSGSPAVRQCESLTHVL